MENELMETWAVNAIKRYGLESPKDRLSARQKHALKNRLIEWARHERHNYESVATIPYHAEVVASYVDHIKSRPILHG